MSKRLTCQHCGAASEYDVPANEVTAPHQEIRCRACGRRFAYGFKPEYVTGPEPPPEEGRPAERDPTYDPAADAVLSRERLARYVEQHRAYHDRDRDVLLLHLIDVAGQIGDELSAIKRVLDVLAKRGR